MDDQRDYSEEAYNAHTIHTGDGEIDDCARPDCPYAKTTDETPTPDLAKVRRVFEGIAESYYHSAQAYAAAANRHRPDNRTRVFHRLRMGTLQQIGDELADALGVASPEWESMRNLAAGPEWTWL